MEGTSNACNVHEVLPLVYRWKAVAKRTPDVRADVRHSVGQPGLRSCEAHRGERSLRPLGERAGARPKVWQPGGPRSAPRSAPRR
jgi:hypothetical protein